MQGLAEETWNLTATGRLVRAVGRRYKDGSVLYVDSTGSWCKADGSYQSADGGARPLQDKSLLNMRACTTTCFRRLSRRCTGARPKG